MKYILLIVVIGGGYYYFSKNPSFGKTDYIPTDFRELFKQLNEGNSVSANAITQASISFSRRLCSDGSLQSQVGLTTKSCNEQLDTFKDVCAEKIFDDETKIYSDKEQVGKLYKRFVKCVGT